MPGAYHRAVIPLVPLGLGFVALAIGAWSLVSIGPRYRVGRLLAATPRVTVAEAMALAESGEARYVRVDGRIDSEAEFEDADHRPLVVRLTRLDTRRGGRWQRLETIRETVAFEVHEGLDAIGVDDAALDEGLVVVPRESVGVVGDLADRAPADLPPDAPARAVIELVSTIEHGTVLGVPRVGPDGRPLLGAGLGRPLVLTTLEPDEAMRILGRDDGRRIRTGVASLAAGAVLVLLGIAWLVIAAVASPAIALAASPAPSGGTASDTRSPGQGPGLVGAPGQAILAVIAIGVLAVALTLVYVRLTTPRQPPAA